MSIHKEISSEEEICAHLAANGWLYPDGEAARSNDEVTEPPSPTGSPE